jgi:hypothetical protein
MLFSETTELYKAEISRVILDLTFMQTLAELKVKDLRDIVAVGTKVVLSEHSGNPHLPPRPTTNLGGTVTRPSPL